VSALSGSSNKDDVGYSTLGARWASNQLMPNGMLLVPRVSLAWQHAFGTVTPTAALAFRSTGAGFGIWGVPIARDAALVEAGGDLHLSLQTKLGIANSPPTRRTIRSWVILLDGSEHFLAADNEH